ncbi:octaprenyl diphosphate synthase [Methylocaldum marinum]|uniref:octaprenyl diphosphate synthase n=1 Tax=Methylocaldum marinum TaxID=1432792 RepID=UPI000E6A60CE
MTIPTTSQTDSTASLSPKTAFTNIRCLVEEETAAVDRLILRELSSDVLLINQIGRYIVNSGGKRLRPMLLLLVSKALQYQGQQHITLAAVIEFIHTATLLHDDVVDESTLRRGRNTVNALWGNSASVLVGDYLYSRSFELMVSVQNLRIMEILSRTTTAIAEGEVLQLLNCNNPATTEHKYLEVISRKTAILFSAAAQLAAVLTGAPQSTELALKDYGLHLGIAFQLIDDALDYMANPEELGKNLGDDLAEGKPTLPLIYAIEHGSASQAAALRDAIENGNRDAFREVYEIVESTDAIAYTARRAREEANKAVELLDPVPASEYKDALVRLAHLSVERNY